MCACMRRNLKLKRILKRKKAESDLKIYNIKIYFLCENEHL